VDVQDELLALHSPQKPLESYDPGAGCAPLEGKPGGEAGDPIYQKQSLCLLGRSEHGVEGKEQCLVLAAALE
jgi:hypothetical protein